MHPVYYLDKIIDRIEDFLIMAENDTLDYLYTHPNRELILSRIEYDIELETLNNHWAFFRNLYIGNLTKSKKNQKFKDKNRANYILNNELEERLIQNRINNHLKHEQEKLDRTKAKIQKLKRIKKERAKKLPKTRKSFLNRIRPIVKSLISLNYSDLEIIGTLSINNKVRYIEIETIIKELR